MQFLALMMAPACATSASMGSGQKAAIAVAGCLGGASVGASLGYAYSASYEASHPSYDSWSGTYYGSAVDYRGNIVIGSLIGLTTTCLPMAIWAATAESDEKKSSETDVPHFEERERLYRMERLERRIMAREERLRDAEARLKQKMERDPGDSPQRQEVEGGHGDSANKGQQVHDEDRGSAPLNPSVE